MSYAGVKNSLVTNSSELISSLKLQEHSEGGYFVETDRRSEQVPTPFVSDKPLRSLATSIYYLLTYDSPSGVIHTNKSVTYHVLHQGRAEYTLITPGNPPKVEKKIMGVNVEAGETRLLIVGTGVWKMSKLLDEDLSGAATKEEKERVNCLITEVVVPGFAWEDHQFLTKEGLRKLFDGVNGGEQMIEELGKHVKGRSD